MKTKPTICSIAILLALTVMPAQPRAENQSENGILAAGDYLVHPTQVFFKDSLIVSGSNLWVSEVGRKDLRFKLRADDFQMEESTAGQLLKWKVKMNDSTCEKTLSVSRECVGIKYDLIVPAGKKGYGEIGLFIPAEAVQDKDGGMSFATGNGQPRAVNAMLERGKRDLGAITGENDGVFTLVGKRKLIITFSGVKFAGSYGARIQDIWNEQQRGLRFLISFNTLEGVAAKIALKICVDEQK